MRTTCQATWRTCQQRYPSRKNSSTSWRRVRRKSTLWKLNTKRNCLFSTTRSRRRRQRGIRWVPVSLFVCVFCFLVSYCVVSSFVVFLSLIVGFGASWRWRTSKSSLNKLNWCRRILSVLSACGIQTVVVLLMSPSLAFRFLNASVFPQVCMASFATNDIHGYCKAIRVTDGSSVTLMRGKGVKAERKWVAAHLSVNSRGLPTACHSYVMKEGKGDNLTRTVLKYYFHLFSSGNALFLALDKN